VAAIPQKEGVSSEEIERHFADGIPLKRANEPDDIAATVLFLASPRSPQHHWSVIQRRRRSQTGLAKW
jgi:NAD(P)-dependent dehydrogenase (short-subunit alcohol dehydrogenase family)